MFKDSYALNKKLSSKVSEQLRDKISEFKAIVPNILDLGNPNMRTRHFEKLFAMIKVSYYPDMPFCLDTLLSGKRNYPQHKDTHIDILVLFSHSSTLFLYVSHFLSLPLSHPSPPYTHPLSHPHPHAHTHTLLPLSHTLHTGGVMNYKDAVAELSGTASGESQLEESLEKIKKVSTCMYRLQLNVVLGQRHPCTHPRTLSLSSVWQRHTPHIRTHSLHPSLSHTLSLSFSLTPFVPISLTL